MNSTVKTTLVLWAILFACFSTVLGQKQESQPAGEHVTSEKIAFFTEKIGLTPKEAEKFWPVYNAYWKKKNAIINERKSKMAHYSKHYKKLSPCQMEKLADDYVQQEVQKAQLLKEYHEKFKKILPIRKVMKIYKADYQFKAYLLKKIKNSGEDENE
jgi:hypothetical protein